MRVRVTAGLAHSAIGLDSCSQMSVMEPAGHTGPTGDPFCRPTTMSDEGNVDMYLLKKKHYIHFAIYQNVLLCQLWFPTSVHLCDYIETQLSLNLKICVYLYICKMTKVRVICWPLFQQGRESRSAIAQIWSAVEIKVAAVGKI